MTRNSVLSAAIGLVTLLGAAPLLAQPAPSSLQSALGDWLYDSHGHLVGSVDAIADGGKTVLIRYGANMAWGHPLVAIPAAEVTVVGDHAELRTLTADALAAYRVD